MARELLHGEHEKQHRAVFAGKDVYSVDRVSLATGHSTCSAPVAHGKMLSYSSFLSSRVYISSSCIDSSPSQVDLFGHEQLYRKFLKKTLGKTHLNPIGNTLRDSLIDTFYCTDIK